MHPEGENGEAAGGANGPRYLRSGTGLSTLDREVIARLQIDGRVPFTELARQVGTTEKTVRRHVKELCDSGVIQITAITDPKALGYQASALLGLTLDGARDVRTVMLALTEVPAVDYVIAATGRYAVYAEVFCANNEELLEVAGVTVSGLPGIAGVEIFPYLSHHYQQAQFASAKARGAPGTGVRAAPLDDTDRLILRELNRDGRVPAQHIADLLGVSESQVRKRIKSMIDHGIVQVLAILNPLGGEYHTIAWLSLSVTPGEPITTVADRLAGLTSITYVVICAGRYDIFAEVVCESNAGLLRTIEEDIRTIPGLAALETSIYLDLHYRPLEPAPVRPAHAAPAV